MTALLHTFGKRVSTALTRLLVEEIAKMLDVVVNELHGGSGAKTDATPKTDVRDMLWFASSSLGGGAASKNERLGARRSLCARLPCHAAC
jgi:hypothetical protein